MASSITLDIAASTFLGFAKIRPSPSSISSIHNSLLFYRNRPSIVTQTRKFLTRTTSFTSPIVHLEQRFSRSFTVSAATTSAADTEDSDVLTKIPPDNRIPATIITGFLGSGKVSSLILILFLSSKLRLMLLS